MERKRPEGRQKYVTNNSKGVHRRGEGLNTGPVGNTGKAGGTGGSGGGNRTTRSGGMSHMMLIIVARVVMLGGGGGIFGAPVVAAASGTVLYTCSYCVHNWGKSGNCGCGGGYGNYVWLDHGNGKETIYAHLTSLTVSEGQHVSQGDVIGYVGSTGHSTGPHLHFECRYDGVKYDPMSEY